MDINSWSLVLGVAGFVLGLVSAFAQLKAMTLAALRFGSDRARRWDDRRYAEAKLFAANASAFVAYLVQCALFFLASTLAFLIITGLSKNHSLAFPSWIGPATNFVFGGLMGIKLALVQSTVRLTRRKASAAHLASVVDG